MPQTALFSSLCGMDCDGWKRSDKSVHSMGVRTIAGQSGGDMHSRIVGIFFVVALLAGGGTVWAGEKEQPTQLTEQDWEYWRGKLVQDLKAGALGDVVLHDAQREVAIALAVAGPQRAAAALSYSDLAQAYGLDKRYADADATYKKALAAARAAYSPTSPANANVPMIMVSLAHNYEEWGRPGPASQVYHRALDLIDAFPEDDPRWAADILGSLASLAYQRSDLEEATRLLKQARDRSPALDEAGTGDVISLASVYTQQKKYDEARDVLLDAKFSFMNGGRKTDPLLGQVLAMLTVVYGLTGEMDMAQEVEKALEDGGW